MKYRCRAAERFRTSFYRLTSEQKYSTHKAWKEESEGDEAPAAHASSS